jgi:hypothetical protein
VTGVDRAAAFSRDSYEGTPTCILAGMEDLFGPCWGGLDPHHLMLTAGGGPSAPGANVVERLATVCRGHHCWIHGGKNRTPAEQAGLIVRRGGGRTDLTTVPHRYTLSPTGWATFTTDGRALPCADPHTDGGMAA